MRKFRGKLKNKYAEEWFYGDLITAKNEDESIDYYIISEDYESKNNIIELGTCQSPKVETDTIGQYTGLKDKNGAEIYEGDMVFVAEEADIATICWDEENAMFIIVFDNWFTDFDHLNGDDLEVIGNIYDNKELLEG